jgi:aryl-alcohol dehydrogenase-like predicted oxidoreductase
MALPTHAYQEIAPDLRICRLLNGLWQLSGTHGRIDAAAALRKMPAYHDDGFTTWDLADHYGPAEDLIGAFRRTLSAERGPESLRGMQAFTKWVPRPARMTRQVVEAAIDVSRRRMDMPTLDLLQFHWWDYRQPDYLDALRHMVDLQAEGKIRCLALTNFDTEHMEQIAAAGVRVISNQVQYSIIDQRPAVKMAAFCASHGQWLLTYGTLCGGLLTDRYLNQPEPGSSQLTTASLRKYKQMIDLWGGWALFQGLLRVLRGIADRYGVSIANVATRFVLDQPAVGGVIVGARLSIAEHRAENARVFGFQLGRDDYAAIAAVTAQARDLFTRIGDCGDEYR